MRGAFRSSCCGLSLDDYCIFLFCLHWLCTLVSSLVLGSLADSLPIPFPFASINGPPLPLHLPACLFHSSRGSGAAVDPCMEHVVRTNIRNCALCSLARTWLVELWCLLLRGSVHPKGHLLLRDKVWACMAPAAPAPSLGAKPWQGSDLWRLKVGTKHLPSEFLVYLFLSSHSFT